MNRKDLATLQRLAAEHPGHRRRNAPDMRMEELLTVEEARRAVAA